MNKFELICLIVCDCGRRKKNLKRNEIKKERIASSFANVVCACVCDEKSAIKTNKILRSLPAE